MIHVSAEDLDAYLDGALTSDEVAMVEAHVAGCPGCCAALEEQRVLFVVCATLLPEPLPMDVSAQVLARLPVGRRWGRGVVALVAQVALTFVLALWLAPWRGGVDGESLVALVFDGSQGVLGWLVSQGERVMGWGGSMAVGVAGGGRVPPGVVGLPWVEVLAVAAIVWVVCNRWVLGGFGGQWHGGHRV